MKRKQQHEREKGKIGKKVTVEEERVENRGMGEGGGEEGGKGGGRTKNEGGSFGWHSFFGGFSELGGAGVYKYNSQMWDEEGNEITGKSGNSLSQTGGVGGPGTTSTGLLTWRKGCFSFKKWDL